MTPLSVRDLMPQDSRKMIFGIEIVNEPGVNIDEAARRAERVEDVVVVNDLHIVVREEIPMFDHRRAHNLAYDAVQVSVGLRIILP